MLRVRLARLAHGLDASGRLRGLLFLEDADDLDVGGPPQCLRIVGRRARESMWRKFTLIP